MKTLALLFAAFVSNPSPVHFVDSTAKAGLHFTHNSGATGKRYLPETLGAGCAFTDLDGDG
ncbi:MAG: CRTAC1 family protein, partial [Bryobacteraceae bacterium]